MRDFTDDQGGLWTATAIEEDTPRHHGRWVLFFHPTGGETPRLPAPEVRWQSRPEAERTLAAMSIFELRRKLAGVKGRGGLPTPEARTPWVDLPINAG